MSEVLQPGDISILNYRCKLRSPLNNGEHHPA